MKRILNAVVRTTLNEGFWLSYWPHSLSIFVQAGAAYITLTFPYESEILHNVLLLANAVGMALAIRGAVRYRKWNQERQQHIEKMHADAKKVIEKVSPLLDELFIKEFGEDWEKVDHQALMRAQALAQEIIEKGFDDLNKSRSSESTPDKT